MNTQEPKRPPKPEKIPGKYYYPGRDFTRFDNQALPCTIRVLPSGDCYGTIRGTMRRLDALKKHDGILISLPDEFDGRNVFIRIDGKLVLVGDEIAAGKKHVPESIVKRNIALIEGGEPS